MNLTESFVTKFYQSININFPSELSILCIAEKLDLEVHFWNFGSAIAERKGIYKIFINNNLNARQQWQEFGHEMSHYFFDQQDKKLMFSSFIDYRETKADYFAYHFCVPTFMLQQFKEVSVYDVMELFNVEFDFALRRLEMYQSKLITRRKWLWREDMRDTEVKTSGS